MAGIALLGSGRMAQVYGPKIAAHPEMELVRVFNPRLASAERVAALHGATASDDLAETLADDRVEAVVIATPTDTHLDYIEASARAGRAIYCEKPLETTLARVDRCLDVLATHPVPFMLGFNRRFDPQITRLRERVAEGELGALRFLQSTSREPAPPPISYVKSSGGYFLDAQIHDIDLMCWIANERPAEVFATGACLVEPAIGAAGDVDTAMTILTFPSGAMAWINNCRACAYGFDQRIELFGEKGLLQTVNRRDDDLIRWDGERTEARQPLKHFFLERYDESFALALEAFRSAVAEGRAPAPTPADGRLTLAVALACERSRRAGRAVTPDY